MAKTKTKIVPIPVPVRNPMPRMGMGAPRINAVPPQASPVPGVPPVGIGGPGGPMKKGGKVHKHASGGKMKSFKEKETMGPRSMGKDVEKGSNKLGKFGESKVQKNAHTKGHNLGDSGKTVKPKDIKPMRKGGYAKVADGIAKRGHTKGKYC